MELKTARLTLLVAPHGREAFERPCRRRIGRHRRGCVGCPVTLRSTVPES
jgi:hypothetical protein